jgi:squalene synthase HpnC
VISGPLADARVGEAVPPGTPSEAEVRAKAAGENFPVASRLLPRADRAHLLAIYAFARLVDDLGDEADGDRLAQLQWAEEELDRAFAESARHPVFVTLGRTIAEVGLPRQPFADLIEANRRDQRTGRVGTFEELLAYCELSANPVGRLVLGVFDAESPARVGLSDRVCSGLQIAEHLQDVAEDAARGRIYLPGEDMARFGVAEGYLAGAPPARADAAFRRLMAFEVGRARSLLTAGPPLVASFGGPGSTRRRIAVAGFVAGGLAALDSIERCGYDVLAHRPRPRPARLVRHGLRLVLGRAR